MKHIIPVKKNGVKTDPFYVKHPQKLRGNVIILLDVLNLYVEVVTCVLIIFHSCRLNKLKKGFCYKTQFFFYGQGNASSHSILSIGTLSTFLK